ncbi:SusD/RagB family nutrient-binding outer membrane lipoprotein [Mucilaginibacter terrae]|uniref:SusD/RagB family nutrient-binding outer membrane lipoprotein n=1 Tax=Mucilaginibacter terrae TaxID=1955052 RepID=UPI0036443469
MKKLYIILMAAGLISASSCKKYLDVNTNPNAPTSVTANLYLSPILSWMATGPVYDGRQISRYIQNFTLTSANSTWDLQGYDPAPSDNGGMLWRTVYFDHGQNLLDMTAKAEAEQRWDLLGVAQVIKAWDWQNLTDIHGEIIIQEAFTPDPTKTAFAYDTQEYAYNEVRRLLNLAIANLQRTDGSVDAAFLGKTDIVYKGDRTKWLKFAYGLLAINLSHYSNKTALYDANAVIAAVDKSFAGNEDDAAVKYTGISNDDRNFIGPTRDNFTSYRQTAFIKSLMDGTQFGGVMDPRMTRMLSPSPDGLYRGLVTGSGVTGIAVNQQPYNLAGYAGIPVVGSPSKYLFDDKSRYPIMTYVELQFIKAEAAYKKGDKTTALDAYRKAIAAHMNYVNATNMDISGTPSQIPAADMATYLNSPSVVPTAANLTLSKIMLQKYIALWGWGFIETWMDLRRYHYLDPETAGGTQVYAGYVFPTTLYVDNVNKPAYRIRPRYASEYVWNLVSLEKIGALTRDYHTKEMWITQP